MKALPLKTIQLTLDYRSNKDLIELFKQIRREIRSGEKQVSSHVNGCRFNYQVLNDIVKLEVKPRVEIINGNTCQVYPSKMNS